MFHAYLSGSPNKCNIQIYVLFIFLLIIRRLFTVQPFISLSLHLSLPLSFPLPTSNNQSDFINLWIIVATWIRCLAWNHLILMKWDMTAIKRGTLFVLVSRIRLISHIYFPIRAEPSGNNQPHRCILHAVKYP